VWRDKDEAGHAHAREVADSLRGKVHRLEIVEAKTGKDAADHLAAGYALDDVVVVEAPPEPRTLAQAIETFRRWVYMPDPGALLVTLGTYAANRSPGDPVWLLLVAAPGFGKTEEIQPLSIMPDVIMVSTMTEPSLLSGTPKKSKAKDATGGLLRRIGDRGVILLKDFGSILSMHRDSRAGILAALREIYDGSWTREVGTDGGRTLSWTGKIGIIAGCTPAIDRHHAVMATMGERFVLYRMPPVDRREMARYALRQTHREGAMRRELADAVAGLFQGVEFPEAPPDLADTEMDRLVALADFVATARSGVERDGYKREVELIPDAEAPTRIAKVLRQLLSGLRVIGADDDTAWAVVSKVALDCLPDLRRKALLYVVEAEGIPVKTPQAARDLGYPTTTIKRALEDLAAHHVLVRRSQGPGYADEWTETEAFAGLRRAAFPEGLGGEPEMSGGVSGSNSIENLIDSPFTMTDDISGSVPNTRRTGGV
jgi:hypothetical protein